VTGGPERSDRAITAARRPALAPSCRCGNDTGMTDTIWHGMTRAELDAAYNNMAVVADSTQRLDDWTARSVVLRQQNPELLDLAYGPRPRNRIDVFRCGKAGAPLFVFIHGGYWQRNAKEMYICIAEGPMARGFDAALIGYSLTPDVTLADIVAETHAAIRWLRREGPTRGFAQNQLMVSGWSAGGHLTAMAMTLAEVDAGLAISGIFDVEPCALNYLNEKLNLTVEEARAMSPVLHLPARSAPLTVTFGANELPELQRQSRDYHAARRAAGLPSTLLPLEGRDHFSVLDELGPDGRLTQALSELSAK
jgi:arylformamidase